MSETMQWVFVGGAVAVSALWLLRRHWPWSRPLVESHCGSATSSPHCGGCQACPKGVLRGVQPRH